MQIGLRGWLPSLLMLLLLPLPAAAVSLGDLVVRSVPGAPLRAHIPFTLLSGEGLTEVRVVLAPAEEYAKRELPRAELLQGLGIALQDRGEGQGRVQLFADQPWQGEAVEVLLLISWSKGEMERHYRLAAVAPAKTAAPAYVAVQQDETLDEIAIRLSKGSNRSYLHMMYALFLANPDAFYRGNMNNLKNRQTLRVPTNEELYALSDGEVFSGIRNQYELWQQSRESSGQRGTQAGEALVEMSAEQTAGLDLSIDSAALQQRLQQVASESEAMQQENTELRERLQALEQRMESVAGQVMEYAAEETKPAEQPETPLITGQVTGKPLAPQDNPEPMDEPESKKDASEPKDKSEGGKGLSGFTLIIAIALVLLAVFFIRRSSDRPKQVSF